MSKSISTFKKYYDNPEYKEKHNKYMSEKTKCICGKMVRRSYMTRHNKTKKHEYEMLKNNKYEKLENEKEIIKKFYKKIIKTLNKKNINKLIKQLQNSDIKK